MANKKNQSVSASEAAELKRLEETRNKTSSWKKWGPYLSERQWGTVREDYSLNGDAWNYFTHDQSRSRAYRWGEDGIAGISDDKQFLCFALALWNGNDPIIKERLFGLTNSESNHGEDVKEYYFYLDSTPTHSYMKYQYKYPQAAFPYEDLVNTSKTKNRLDYEYELIDTGVFDGNRYFDVDIEYAKESPEDILIKVTAHNRGPEDAELSLLPTLWFRNTWSWGGKGEKPSLKQFAVLGTSGIVKASHPEIGEIFLYCEGAPELLFTENETNTERVFSIPNENQYVKDGINNFIVNDTKNAVNPDNTGTKVAAAYKLKIKAGESR
ncbi:MAG: glucosidase, partial [Flavisolibacter sp.]